MEKPRASTLVLIGLILSLVLHAMVILPAMVAVMKSETRTREIVKARFEPEAFRDHEKLPADLVRLGIDESEASTMTWIGYEEYEQHMAALSEVEQAAFQTEPTGAEPAQATAGPSPLPDDAMARAAQPIEALSPTDQPQPPTAPDPFDDLETWLKGVEGPGPPVGDPVNPQARPRALEDMLDQLEQMMPQPEPQSPDREAEKAKQPQQPPQPPQPAVPVPAQPQEPAPPKPVPSGKPGEQADQESDATSTLEVSMEQLTLGRPLAAKGLRIKPRKPVFTTLTLLTAAPADPKAELRFRRDGKPALVRLLQSSGDPRIDEAVLNSLYRWRAAGKELGELKPGQTIPVRIRIMLSSGR